MTVPVLRQTELIDYIKDNGWEMTSDIFFLDHNRLVFEKEDSQYTFKCKGSLKYFYLEVFRICTLLQIPVSPDHAHSYYLHKGWQNKNCYCEQGRIFSECCGIAI